jgi:hypothetical protein
MEGTMKITYTVLCENDINQTVTVEDLLANENIAKVIKSYFAPKQRNIKLSVLAGEAIKLSTIKTIYSFEIPKDDFADALTIAEEDAKKNKRFKKGSEQVELVDIETL